MRIRHSFALLLTVLSAALLLSCNASPDVSPTTTPTVEVTPTATASPALVALASSTNTATPLPEPTRTPTPAARPTSSLTEPFSPLPSPTATWTPTPTPSAADLQQTLEEIAPLTLLAFFAETSATSLAELDQTLQPVIARFNADRPQPNGPCSVRVASVEESDESGVPAVVVLWGLMDENYQTCRQHGMLPWLDPDTSSWQVQLLPWIQYISYYQGGRLARQDQTTEMLMVNEQCHSESGKDCDYYFSLYRLEEGYWQTIWTSPANRNRVQDNDRLHFTGEGINTVEIETTSLGWGDPKSTILVDPLSNGIRVFVDTWQRDEDFYVLTGQRTRPSAYNTLVEFLYALNNDGDPVAWVARAELVDTARELLLQYLPPQNMLEPNFTDPLWVDTGPLILGFHDQRITFTFVQRDAQYLVDTIQIEP